MKSMPSIFISRNVSKKSSLHSLTKYTIEGRSLIDFDKIHFDVDLENYDWVFIYSSVGAMFFLKGIDIDQLKEVKIACLGPKTAQTYAAFSGKTAEFIGDGDPELTRIAFKKTIESTDSILFVRALHSRDSVQKGLKDFDCHSLITYNNTLSAINSIAPSNIVVLTSPMNAENYFKSCINLNKPTFIAIGKTTGDYIYAYTGRRPLLPKFPSEESISQLILSL